VTLDPNEPRFPIPGGLKRPCKTCGGTDGFAVLHGPGYLACCSRCEKSLGGYFVSKVDMGIAKRSVRSQPGVSTTAHSRILERDRWACMECGRRPPDVALEVGHLISKAQGQFIGMTAGELNSDENLYAVCQECNAGRSTRSIDPIMLFRLMRARRGNQET
jgi:5-methylcytosine-specific restriction endonuclease McrA